MTTDKSREPGEWQEVCSLGFLLLASVYLCPLFTAHVKIVFAQ